MKSSMPSELTRYAARTPLHHDTPEVVAPPFKPWAIATACIGVVGALAIMLMLVLYQPPEAMDPHHAGTPGGSATPLPTFAPIAAPLPAQATVVVVPTGFIEPLCDSPQTAEERALCAPPVVPAPVPHMAPPAGVPVVLPVVPVVPTDAPLSDLVLIEDAPSMEPTQAIPLAPGKTWADVTSPETPLVLAPQEVP